MVSHSVDAERLEVDVVVVGAGIAGLSSALELAETGFTVLLVEKNPYVGGRVAQLYEYFPKLCPPTCGLEINIRRLRENNKIKLLTTSIVKSFEKTNGKLSLTIQQNPRFVNSRCTLCGDCLSVCPVDRPNDFNFGLDTTKAIYYPYNNAYPQRYVIDEKYCQFENCKMCVDVCKYKAIDLGEKKKIIDVSAKSVVWATGWDPYDATRLDHLGFGKYPNVITNMMMERIASPSGPTNGVLRIPNLDIPINEVAFVQCAGSRDENHLEYCSSICCLASMKQATYIRTQYPNAKVHIFYIDLRANGILEDFYNKTKSDPMIEFHRGKVAKVFQNPINKRLLVEAEDTLTGRLIEKEVDLVVLATGMQPTTAKNSGFLGELLDENGFIRKDSNDGIVGCGVCVRPKDVASVVQEATGAAMKAIVKIKEVQ
ncbi:CoB--CoM heterodisulfide reductase iron-sulfur subunit A family protein [Bacteroidetes/Chlorobi group bacterium Naka2016]|jgi:quinone-modifying oxidoreductase subunit QmoA|nr:MAG: CoB--CoM heterodisulfide reductase iron-sulfur subunit A family protein [Bacteroidetes/Chlorobi group bacterium Naka2016]